MDIGKPEIAALVAVDEAFVVDAHEVHEGGMEVVHMHRLVDNVVAVLVCLSVADTRLYAAAGEPHGETAWVVVAAVVGFSEDTLAVGRAPEFATPDDECVIQHAESFEVFNQGCLRLVGVFALETDFIRKSSVLVPSAVVELHEADAAFSQSPRHEAVVGVGSGNLHIGSVHVEGLG